jgi:hypothetical protein
VDRNATVHLAAGNYSGYGNVGLSGDNFTALSGVALVGAGAGFTVVECTGEGKDVTWLRTANGFVTSVRALSVTRCRGISALNSSLAVSDCAFSNHASNQVNGTGIFASAGGRATGRPSLVVERCSFNGLAASFGGALTVAGRVQLAVFSSNFTGNGVVRETGAVVASNGGAVWLTSVEDARFHNCRFEGNMAQISGGAVKVQSDAGAGASTADRVPLVVSFSKCVFLENEVRPSVECASSIECDSAGGAAYIEADVATFDGCLLEGNRVSANPLSGGRGGAIYAAPAQYSLVLSGGLSWLLRQGVLVLSGGTVLESNSVKSPQGSTSTCSGGALYVSYLTVTIEGAVLRKNHVGLGASVVTAGGNTGGRRLRGLHLCAERGGGRPARGVGDPRGGGPGRGRLRRGGRAVVPAHGVPQQHGPRGRPGAKLWRGRGRHLRAGNVELRRRAVPRRRGHHL